MAALSKGDSVKVVKVPSGPSVLGRNPRVGDTATIRYVLGGVGILYVAERVAPTGKREWLCEFVPGDLELVER
jgi:hypothetical protein